MTVTKWWENKDAPLRGLLFSYTYKATLWLIQYPHITYPCWIGAGPYLKVERRAHKVEREIQASGKSSMHSELLWALLGPISFGWSKIKTTTNLFKRINFLNSLFVLDFIKNKIKFGTPISKIAVKCYRSHFHIDWKGLVGEKKRLLDGITSQFAWGPPRCISLKKY